MQEKNSKKSFWPYGIAISILMIAAACIYNVKIALEHPVEYDTYFFSKKQILDDKINDYLASQGEFNKNYNVELILGKLNKENNNISIKVTNKKTDEIVKNAYIELLVTRPDESSSDIRPNFTEFKDNTYKFSSFDVTKKGRWFIQFKTTVGKLSNFVKIETYADFQ